MTRAWMHLTLLVTLVVLLSATASSQKKPPPAGRPVAPADPLRVALEKKGYVAVPLSQEDEGGCFTVECKSGTETFRLGLDTGAELSSLDMGLVKKLGLKHGDEITGLGIEGIRKGVKVSLRGFSAGDFDSRATANSLSFQAFDFTAANTSRDQRKRRRIDGLLGLTGLRFNSAVIDYSSRTLYLRTPLDGLWPEIEGRWVATRGQEDGQERPIDPKAPPRLEFKGRRFHLTDGASRYTFGLHVKPGKDSSTLALFDPGQELAKELNYEAVGLLKVSGDRLTVCLCLDLSKAKEFPDAFEAPAGSGLLLLEFRREK